MMNDQARAGLLDPGSNCWRIEMASRASVIIDAADYFVAAQAAMRKARHRIMLVGWDFDTRIRLGDNPADDGEQTVGDFISALVDATAGLEIYLLRWDMGALKLLTRGSTALTLLKWMSHPRIHTKLDGTHPTGASHHQKIVVVDDCMAFCGGIDMTSGRWDTRLHRDDDPGRIGPDGEPYPPWHDATSALEGPVAAALGDLCRDRWERAGCKPLEPVKGAMDCWPDDLPVDFENVEVAIARSEPDMPGRPAVLEIERLYLDQIAGARRFIYAESQYFASRRVGEAIARRLDEADGPEIVIINPVTSNGWLEPIAMDSARARLVQALRRRDKHGRLRIYHPFTDAGEQIYVHAKMLIVDDEILRVGSSNINNRSLRLDTECDIAIDARQGGNASRVKAIRAIRDGLIAEHLDETVQTVADAIDRSGSLIAAIETLRPGKNRLRPYVVPDVEGVDKWLADNEILDPEGPDEMFEPMTDRGLFRGGPFSRHES
jgi:phosphatidylserine/phosphatidylglycerophosphate/cardiolipin synthase-like enzyme